MNSSDIIAPNRGRLAVLAIGALLNFISCIVLRRELLPGEFGTVNTILGVVAVAAAPVLALALVPRHGILSREESALWSTHLPAIMRLATLGLGGFLLVLLFALLPFLSLPRVSLQMFTVLAVEAALAARLAAILCRATHRLVLMGGLIIAGAAVRLAVSAFGAHYQPWAQTGVGAVVLAGAIAAIPALQDYAFPPFDAGGRALLRKLLFPLSATASVILAVALFANAHRIVAQPNFGTPDTANFGFVNLNGFDDFQAAGLIAFGVLMITLPLLIFFGARRAALSHTTRASLRWFWIYLGALFAGVLALIFVAPLANAIFSGNPAAFLPSFAAPVFMIGLLQGMAVFALASQRWIECLVLGASGIAYTLFLFFAGHQPQLMTTYMFGGALISLMLVLFVGVVRYARSHP
jgi:hypothetical protein